MPNKELIDKLNENLEEIDEQHQYFRTLYNDLMKLKNEPANSQEMADFLSSLVAYVDFHHMTEEKYFDLVGYEDAEGHKQDHEKTLKNFHGFVDRFNRGENIYPELERYFNFLLKKATVELDGRYAEVVKEKIKESK